MSDPKYDFQYCQKLVIFSEDWTKILLVKRQHEIEYDGMFAFVGGKMEGSDKDIIAGVQREKNEEIGEAAKLKLFTGMTRNYLYRKSDGGNMILPHYLAHFQGGEITLNPEEYSEYRWVPISELANFEPKIENIPEAVQWALEIKPNVNKAELVDI